jgi:thiamine transporter ThiT
MDFFASFVPNIHSLQQTFFVDLALLQLVYFAIVDGKMATTTTGLDYTCI